MRPEQLGSAECLRNSKFGEAFKGLAWCALPFWPPPCAPPQDAQLRSRSTFRRIMFSSFRQPVLASMFSEVTAGDLLEQTLCHSERQ